MRDTKLLTFSLICFCLISCKKIADSSKQEVAIHPTAGPLGIQLGMSRLDYSTIISYSIKEGMVVERFKKEYDLVNDQKEIIYQFPDLSVEFKMWPSINNDRITGLLLIAGSMTASNYQLVQRKDYDKLVQYFKSVYGPAFQQINEKGIKGSSSSITRYHWKRPAHNIYLCYSQFESLQNEILDSRIVVKYETPEEGIL